MSRKIIGVTVGTQLPKPNFKQTDPTKGDYIKNKPDFDGLKGRVDAVSTLVGDKAVSEQINDAVAGLQDELNSKYEKPSTGISKEDLSSGVQSSLNKADTAIQSLNGYATETYVNTQVADLVNSAPETLNTLNELAAALGNDENFASTVAQQIGAIDAKVGDETVAEQIATAIESIPEATWENLPDKPFGGYRNSISWASRGIDPTTLPEETWIKMSDAVITMEDFSGSVMEASSFSYYVEEYDTALGVIWQSFVGSNYTCGRNVVYPIREGVIGCLLVDNAGNEHSIIECRQDGIYFSTGFKEEIPGWVLRRCPMSLTINGCAKFESYEPLDSRYMPEGLQTETITMTDVISYDRIADDNNDNILDISKASSVMWLEDCRMISDVDFPVKSCYVYDTAEDGGYVYDIGYLNCEFGVFRIVAYETQDGIYPLVAMEESGDIQYIGVCMTKESGYDPGIYLYDWFGGEFSSNAGAVFKVRTPKPIDKKYLPDDIGSNADTLDGKHADEFVLASDLEELIAVEDIDSICGASITYARLNEGVF